jgi:hypothetical protein
MMTAMQHDCEDEGAENCAKSQGILMETMGKCKQASVAHEEATQTAGTAALPPVEGNIQAPQVDLTSLKKLAGIGWHTSASAIEECNRKHAEQNQKQSKFASVAPLTNTDAGGSSPNDGGGGGGGGCGGGGGGGGMDGKEEDRTRRSNVMKMKRVHARCAMEEGKTWVGGEVLLNVVSACNTPVFLRQASLLDTNSEERVFTYVEGEQLSPGNGQRFVAAEQEVWQAVASGGGDRGDGGDGRDENVDRPEVLHEWVVDISNGVVQDVVLCYEQI